MGNEGRASAGRPPIGYMAVAVILLLALSGAAAGCSSGGRRGTGSSACNAARSKFVIFSNATADASNSASDAWNHWTDTYNRSLNGQISQQQISAGITEFNADFQKTQAAAKKVTEESATFLKAYGSCNQSSMPKGCQDEFAQYQPLIAHETREAQATGAVFDAINAQIVAENPETGTRETLRRRSSMRQSTSTSRRIRSTRPSTRPFGLHRRAAIRHETRIPVPCSSVPVRLNDRTRGNGTTEHDPTSHCRTHTCREWAARDSNPGPAD